MTAIWGPLGWMTLHSVATSYPEVPTLSEKQLMVSWLDMFRDTITCPSCREHFTSLLATYRKEFPNMLSSRQDFAVFSFRAHNAVNRRLSKPIYNTLEECMATLLANIKTRTAQSYRVSYVNHITRYWKTMQDIAGIVALRKVAEMKKIDMEYITSRDTFFAVTLQPAVVVLPRDVLEKNPAEVQRRPVYAAPPSAGLRFTSAGFRLRR